MRHAILILIPSIVFKAAQPEGNSAIFTLALYIFCTGVSGPKYINAKRLIILI
jgi:hypothetical protein